ncbi:substrate-binding domain-containing protein [Castellaniella sp.]|uniref:substrate-binding domain-containing protein n=1 Tax=Castellaniella sp. TaxID=1955812 RepID=UPI00356AD901
MSNPTVLAAALALAALVGLAPAQAAEPIRIAHITSLSGAFTAYGEQLQRGLEMGLDYATSGRMQVAGRPLVLTLKDDQMDPNRGRALVEEAYAQDGVDLVVGPMSSGVAVAVMPLAEEYGRIIMPEGVADSITGKDWNRHVVRVGQSSSIYATANAIASTGPGTCVATIAQDYVFGRDSVAVYRNGAQARGAQVVHEEYLPFDTTDFTAAAQRLFDALGQAGECPGGRLIFSMWAGASNPIGRINDLHPERLGIRLAAPGDMMPILTTYAPFDGMEGATYYYYELPDNPVNDDFVRAHQQKYGTPPDYFTAQGFAQGMAIVAALEKSGGASDAEDLIAAFEGLTFDSPKGPQTIRPADHQAQQVMYHFRLQPQERSDWFAGRTVQAGVPQLLGVIPVEQLTLPPQNGE